MRALNFLHRQSLTTVSRNSEVSNVLSVARPILILQSLCLLPQQDKQMRNNNNWTEVVNK